MAAKPNVQPLDSEITFKDLGMSGKPLITKTDLNGKITFVNRNYTILSAYSKEELMGKAHSIMRHPDMPESAFKGMWDLIKADRVWEGYVKNLRGDGKYYWVIVRIESIFDDNGQKIGYIALRKEPDFSEVDRKRVEYKEMREKELKS
jgi:aerotaxis receptor